MKILVVSFLRLGDFLQGGPVLAGLKRRHPDSRLDTLTFAPVARLRDLIPCVNRWWTLDRDELQAGLGRADIPILTAFDVLREDLDRVAEEGYDLIVNLTSSRFAGLVCGYLPAREKIGLAILPGDRPQFHSPWFRYLNERAGRPSADMFNYTDIFLGACGLDEPAWPLVSTEVGRREAAALGVMTAGPRILCQPFTSDNRKNWPRNQWRRFLSGLRERIPNANLLVLGSEHEETGVNEIVAGSDSAAVPAIVSLEGAMELLATGDLLVTGDTSIKHMANAGRARVLELSLGPSDFRRTGIYKSGSLILQPRLGCAPCAHTGGCTQSRQICAEVLSPDGVVEAAVALLADDWSRLSRLADTRPETGFFRAERLETGFWNATDMARAGSTAGAEDILERCARRFLLNQEDRKPFGRVGSEAVALERVIERLTKDGGFQSLLARLEFIEREEGRRVHSASRAADEVARGARTGQLDFASLRSAQRQARDEARHAEIKCKLVRSLKNRLMERT